MVDRSPCSSPTSLSWFGWTAASPTEKMNEQGDCLLFGLFDSAAENYISGRIQSSHTTLKTPPGVTIATSFSPAPCALFIGRNERDSEVAAAAVGWTDGDGAHPSVSLLLSRLTTRPTMASNTATAARSRGEGRGILRNRYPFGESGPVLPWSHRSLAEGALAHLWGDSRMGRTRGGPRDHEGWPSLLWCRWTPKTG